MNASHNLTCALSYATRQGWAVFPVRRPLDTGDGVRCSCVQGPDCPSIGKHPRVRWRSAEPATTDPAVIRAWWTRWPTDNVGIATGGISQLLVVDVDKRSGGWESVAALDAEHGWAWRTARVLTPTGGAHFYYRHPGGISNSAGKIAPGIDVRGDGGLVLAPPSLHRNGGLYQWQHVLVPGGDRDVAPLA